MLIQHSNGKYSTLFRWRFVKHISVISEQAKLKRNKVAAQKSGQNERKMRLLRYIYFEIRYTSYVQLFVVRLYLYFVCVRAVRRPKRDVNESNLKLLLTHHCVCMCTTLFYPLYPLNIGGMVMCVSRLYILAIRSWYCRVFFSRISWQRCDEEWMEIQTHALTLTYTQYQSSTHRQTRMARYYEYMFREFDFPFLYVRHMTTVELCSDMATAIEKCSAHRDAIKSTLYKALRLKLGIVQWMRKRITAMICT